MGRISEIVWAYPLEELDRPYFDQHWGELLRSLSDSAQVFMLCLEKLGPQLREHPWGEQIIPVPIPKRGRRRFAWSELEWIQDYFSMGTNDTFLLPRKANIWQEQVAIELARITGRALRPTNLEFEGGNIIRIGNTMLAGKNTWDKNHLYKPSGELDHRGLADLEMKIQSLWGVERILWLGRTKHRTSAPRYLQSGQTTFQPFFHLDLFLLPIDEGKVLLGQVDPENTINPLRKDFGTIEEIREELDHIDQQLKASGIQTVGIPLPLHFELDQLKIYSSLNGLCETLSSGPRCILPSYRDLVPTISKVVLRNQMEITKILHQEGIQVRFVEGNFGASAKRAGALHCKTNVLTRTPHGN